jgi:hypothetical protein
MFILAFMKIRQLVQKFLGGTGTRTWWNYKPTSSMNSFTFSQVLGIKALAGDLMEFGI